MTITTKRDGSHVTLAIEGRVDTNTSAQLIGQKTALTKGATMELLHIQPTVLTVLELSGFDSILNIK